MMKHLARDHDVDGLRGEGQGVAVAHDDVQAVVPRQSRRRGDYLETDGRERDAMPARCLRYRPRDIPEAGSHVEQCPVHVARRTSHARVAEQGLEGVDDRPRPAEQRVESRDVPQLIADGARVSAPVVQQLSADHPLERLA